MHSGVSLLEAVLYVALLGLVLVMIVNVLLILSRGRASLVASKNINNSAITTMERLTREIREAAEIKEAVGESVFNTNPGELWLESPDTTGIATTTRFYLSGGKLFISKNGSTLGALTVNGTTVAGLVFRKIDTSTSTAIKVELQLRSGSGAASHTENFYTTTVLRGSY